MEVLILVTVIVGFITNIFVMRYFFRQLSQKTTLPEGTTSTTYPTQSIINPLNNNPLFNNTSGGTTPFEMPTAPNQVMDENLNDVEFNEQTFNSLPSDLKVEVEGGDTNTPPEFDEKGGSK